MIIDPTEQKQLAFDRGAHSDAFLIDTYEKLVYPRIIEEKMLSLLRQGRISKWFSGIGQEAIAVGAAMALRNDEYILPMHRNLGVFTARGMPFRKLFAQWQGKATGYSKGRERSFHFGDQEHKVVGMISHLGPQMGIADGIALAHKLKKEDRCVIVFTGDGATSEGDFHESLNVAAVWDLPVLFVIENNGYGLSTPSHEQFRMKSFVDKAVGYGIEGVQVAGNNILEVYDTLARLADSVRENPRPILVECITFRMRGHEEASGTKYVPKELFEEWGRKDPVANYEEWLLRQGILSIASRDSIRTRLKDGIEEDLKHAFEEPDPVAVKEVEEGDVYARSDAGQAARSPLPLEPDPGGREARMIDAIQEGLSQSMERHADLVLMGQDIAEYGGAFKITEGFVERFGKGRVRNTPLCESAILGTALGLSIKGMKAMMEMQFADFVSEGITQICNNLAKIHYRWGQNADVVVRMPTGAGVGAGPFHSQSNEMWFVKTPGLKVVYPSTPYDAKGLLMSAFEDPGPVMFFEHKALYRATPGPVPEQPYGIPFGKARTVHKGGAMSIITYGMGVHWATAVQQETGADIEIIDLRTLVPLDTEAVLMSAKKTGRVLLLHEDTLTAGFGGELAALIAEQAFEHLDAPIVRVASWDTPVPFAISLENGFLPKNRLREAVERLMAY
ncbi:MAG: dehydrogenase E1 component subunit alpha/beta [Bacteroidetes bacterium]|nr:dehydrogenase E1 component subunit alpha/beta [Bacteroidota bacterium]MBX7128417.1 dehydrogenase E1 component subunit alpha/beta [Flavobacteriales bacterium]HNI04667.1 dehydrogenase E1 component subunit alpha/beta [Flavobacteriales bacterium]HNK85682.1 dehydrogenase E1 component subunit alpha/beta [Flavobacteriales bacterium]HNM71133.1 dehydrogenase E1 component subunit alpha/beta [Flavobacteriales bacterium]